MQSKVRFGWERDASESEMEGERDATESKGGERDATESVCVCGGGGGVRKRCK